MPQPLQTVTQPETFKLVQVRQGDSFASLADTYLHDTSLGWVIAEFNKTDRINPGDTLVIPLIPLNPGGLEKDRYTMVPVLCYHKFGHGRGRADIMTVSDKAFQQQMAFLKTNGYHVLTLDQFFDFAQFKRDIPKKSVVITVDDGWRSFYEIAFPILKEFGYPATVFVYTDFVGQGGAALDWDTLRELERNGITVETHTRSHRNLNHKGKGDGSREYFEVIKREVLDSKRRLEEKLQKKIKYIAYPYGEENHLVTAFLAKNGFRGGFTTERGSNPFFIHPYRMRRSMVYGTFDIEDFKSNLRTSGNEALK